MKELSRLAEAIDMEFATTWRHGRDAGRHRYGHTEESAPARAASSSDRSIS